MTAPVIRVARAPGDPRRPAVGWGIDRLLRTLAGGAPPPPIESLIVIEAPIERVWAVVADIEGQPRWMHE